MYNPGEDDNELDRLSREAAGAYKAPGMPDWEAMEARLDKALPVERSRRRFGLIWWIAPALLTAGVAGWMLKGAYGDKHVNATTVTQQPAAPANNSNDKNQPVTASSPAQAAPTVEENTVAAKGKDITASSPSIASIAGGQSLHKKSPLQLGDLSRTTTGIGATTSPDQQPSAVINNATNSNPGADKNQDAQKTAASSSIASNTAADAKNESKLTDVNNPKEENVLPASTDRKVGADQPASAVTESSATNTVTVTNKAKREKAWSIALVGGVDKSNVKFRYDYEAGYNAGLVFGYHFSKTWSVHTGAIITQKNYKMEGADFHAPKGSWIGNYPLENVEGYCRMWEVPIEVRYTLPHTGKFGVFFGAGLSSYFMTSENYDYAYYWNGTLYSKNMGYTSGEKNILSIASLSAGFEQRISDKVSVQISPYAKIPLGNVGTGSFRLNSFGINFAAQFKKAIGKH